MAQTIAKALWNKGVALGRLDRRNEALAAYYDLVARFEDASEPPLREQVEKAKDALRRDHVGDDGGLAG